jgi:hypothetical protein
MTPVTPGLKSIVPLLTTSKRFVQTHLGHTKSPVQSHLCHIVSSGEMGLSYKFLRGPTREPY